MLEINLYSRIPVGHMPPRRRSWGTRAVPPIPLLERWGALPAVLVMGTIHAVWYYPSDYSMGQTRAMMAWGTLLTIAFRILTIWLYNNTPTASARPSSFTRRPIPTGASFRAAGPRSSWPTGPSATRSSRQRSRRSSGVRRSPGSGTPALRPSTSGGGGRPRRRGHRPRRRDGGARRGREPAGPSPAPAASRPGPSP